MNNSVYWPNDACYAVYIHICGRICIFPVCEVTLIGSRHTVDATDLAILAELQMDATIANAELAQRIGMSPSACLARVKRLRESEVIQQCPAVVNPHAVGLEVAAFTFVTLSPHRRDTASCFVETIRAMAPVTECHNITGQWDYLLKIVAPNITAYRDFVLDRLLTVPGVEKVETLINLGTEKQSFLLPLEWTEGEIT